MPREESWRGCAGARSPVEEGCVRAGTEQAPHALDKWKPACSCSFDGPRSNLHQRSNASVSSTGGGSFALCPQRCQPNEEEEESKFLSKLV